MIRERDLSPTIASELAEAVFDVAPPGSAWAAVFLLNGGQAGWR